MPDIEKRLEAFCACGPWHCSIILDRSASLKNSLNFGHSFEPKNADVPFPLVFTVAKRKAADYFGKFMRLSVSIEVPEAQNK